MRIKGRKVILENLRDSKTGETVSFDLPDGFSRRRWKVRHKKMMKRAREMGSRHRQIFMASVRGE